VKIFDSVKKAKVDFIPIEDGHVKMYVCGPTVYDDAHLGHARSAVSFDLLHRLFLQLGYKVEFAKNYTDIDDKILDKMKKSGESLKEITEKYINSYESDMKNLGILEPTIKPKATENLKAMENLVSNLLQKDFAYKTSSGDIYFDTSKDKKYLSISGRVQNSEERVSRLKNSENEKRNPEDFILWKGEKKSDEVSFQTSFGSGRPGWHIECSAMIEEHLSYKNREFSIDIHGGGADLLFPHHENEASQSRCSTEHELAKYWLHNGFVQIDGTKMSKSLGNSFFVKDSLNFYSGEVLRFYLLSTHYRQDFNFSEEELLNSKKRLDKIYRLKKRLYGGKVGEANKTFKNEILEILKDDLNISETLAKIDEFVSDANEKIDSGKVSKIEKREILGNIEFLNLILGVGGNDSFQHFQFGVSDREKEKIENLILERTNAKKEKNFELADKIRSELESFGIQIMDTANGTLWEKTSNS
jgi:cysteinyl-tRNA synthetase